MFHTLRVTLIRRVFLSIISILALFSISCDQFSKNNNFQIFQDMSGKITVFDSKAKKLLIVNESNRITDVVDLELSPEQINEMKTTKEINDKRVKINNWPEFHPPSEKYTVNLSTRFYKDQLLYKVTIQPCDERIIAKSIIFKNIILYDSSKFVLEDIDLPFNAWTKLIDSTGTINSIQTTGKIPMNLDSYMEIAKWTTTWYKE